MIKKPHPVLAVPVIALVDGVLMGVGNRAYELITGNYSIIEWPGSFWILFGYTLILALPVGAVLSPIFYVVGEKLSKPKLLWLLLAGIVLGPLPITILNGHAPELKGMVTFSLLGAVSAAVWWLLVEVPRSESVAA